MRFPALFGLVFLTVTVKAQGFQDDKDTGIAMGLSGGYSSKGCVIGNLSVGEQFKGQNHVSINLQVLGKIAATDVPVIGEVRLGHGFGVFEPYIGVGYHYGSSDADKPLRKQVNGWKPALGILLKIPDTHFTISTGMSGNIFSVQVGVFGVR